MDPFIHYAAQVKPSERQIEWQKTEFYAFIHFTMNTFTDKEWGLGDEDPAIFNPVQFDADQWVSACKSAGMKGLILTCKHHDGFCLWPSRFTDHSVKSSPWKDGQGDMVKEVADACRRGGIKFGVYLSPWDRHELSYGDSPAYNAFFKGQLRELLTEYGELFCVWFDGACGEGPNGKKQVYDWDGYVEIIRELQPNAVISVCGPDVRWCGNEAGYTRESEWSVVPAVLTNKEKIMADSQQEDDGEFSRRIDTMVPDLGSREVIRNYDELVWYPAEVNTSIRPGWFYHASEDDQVRSLEELLDIYYGAVGGNATFLLNLPPDQRGLIHENDVKRLKELGSVISRTFQDNLAVHATAEASSTAMASCHVNKIFDGDPETYWHSPEGTEQAVIEIDLQEEQTFDRIVLMEHIRSGQRIERFYISCKLGDVWHDIHHGTIVGYKRICRMDRVTTRHIRLTITESRQCPTLSSFGVYKEAPPYTKGESTG
ncbi:alpha-fucosidase [Paenibacillus sp. HJL G12]|uniref:alpha-L-fucosidase n=1 Tax=Paenibacillus dendrobii TaxID=2691084 RepID=A0A7X3LHN7_9BACL|nr:alpha-L-fucosidase [Paenibacillus dendrobii]MWV46026.1 alpha-fucosidase [Paenibacillus dendrobii]